MDLVLTGHTHTYERFRVTRRDGRGFHLVNLSGKPEPWFLWFGDGARRAQDLRGNEEAWLYEKRWSGLTGWTVSQEEVMTKKEADQLGLFTIDAEGGVTLSISYLGRASMEAPVRDGQVPGGVPTAAS